MCRPHIRVTAALLALCGISLAGCDDLMVRDASSLLVPTLMRSELVGIVAGFGTTFAAVPDLVAMFRRRSSEGMNPRMAAIMCVFQVVWVYYGLLILSRPVIAWNAIAVMINLSSVAAFVYFARRQRASEKERPEPPVPETPAGLA